MKVPFCINAIGGVEQIQSVQPGFRIVDDGALGLVGGVELESREGQPGTRAYDAFLECFKNGVMVRFTGDILAFSPPLIIEESHIDQIFSTVRQALRAVN